MCIRDRRKIMNDILQFEVQDNGPGMSEEVIQNLFEDVTSSEKTNFSNPEIRTNPTGMGIGYVFDLKFQYLFKTTTMKKPFSFRHEEKKIYHLWCQLLEISLGDLVKIF
eukprot:TRINITY_DN13884_c0_g1_i1.p1 TRINITY_DN13884_c0_g1~~TRINITY_DN13884_c0_g1_i1.p1  ORF type:complete len:109 (+),score=6.15 TRINITY_DN13884_c0_g1_i1:64-390(+)